MLCLLHSPSPKPVQEERSRSIRPCQTTGDQACRVHGRNVPRADERWPLAPARTSRICNLVAAQAHGGAGGRSDGRTSTWWPASLRRRGTEMQCPRFSYPQAVSVPRQSPCCRTSVDEGGAHASCTGSAPKTRRDTLEGYGEPGSLVSQPS